MWHLISAFHLVKANNRLDKEQMWAQICWVSAYSAYSVVPVAWKKAVEDLLNDTHAG